MNFELILSILAIILAFLAYLDNRKNTKFRIESEEERKQEEKIRKKERNDIKQTIKLLIDFAKELYEIDFQFGAFYDASNGVLRELSEKGDFKLKIEIKNPDLNLLPIKNPGNTEGVRGKTIYSLHTKDTAFEMELKLRVEPKITTVDWIEVDDVLYNLVCLYGIFNELKKYETIIEPFDSQIIQETQSYLDNILATVQNGIDKKSYEIEFKKGDKSSEIDLKLNEIINLKEANSLANSHAPFLIERIETIKNKLFKYGFG